MTKAAKGVLPYWEPPARTQDDFDDVDREALDRCIRLVLDDNDDIAPTIREYLKDNQWWDAAMQACYGHQCDHLQLDGSESPPCWIAEDEIDDIVMRGAGSHNPEFGGALLLKKMLALGVSKFDPRPVDAMAAAQRGKRKGK